MVQLYMLILLNQHLYKARLVVRYKKYSIQSMVSLYQNYDLLGRMNTIMHHLNHRQNLFLGVGLLQQKARVQG